jgi:hypothetical protein
MQHASCFHDTITSPSPHVHRHSVILLSSQNRKFHGSRPVYRNSALRSNARMRQRRMGMKQQNASKCAFTPRRRSWSTASSWPCSANRPVA